MTIFDQREDLATTKATLSQQLRELYAEIGRLTSQLNWLKNCRPLRAANLSVRRTWSGWRQSACKLIWMGAAAAPDNILAQHYK